MTCERALRTLLEADPAELEGRADTSLARHVRGCERCRARARAILEDTALLDRTLEDLTTVARTGASPEINDRAAARQAISAARERESWATPSDHTAEKTGRRPDGSEAAKHGWLRAAVPLAAAAVLALLYVVGEPPPPQGGWEPPSPPSTPTAPAPSVEPGESAGTVAVFETSDPEITVVWFFPEE